MPPLSEAPFGAEVPLLPIIEQAKSLLEKETVVYIPEARRSPARREIKLALANFKSGEIRVVSGVETRQKLTLNDPEIRFEVEWWNGFNSSLSVIEPPSTGVVAMLYALDSQRQKFFGQDAIIYTPYSNALSQTELVQAGKNYLLEKTVQARKELEQVESRAVPGVSLGSDRIYTLEDYFNIILTEQMDPARFRSIAAGATEFNEGQERDLMRLAERILVIIGANQEDAYRFTGNYASARGLTQFTPVGMRVVWDQYPEARIPRSFLEATSDHVSAIKAEICLLDHYLAELSRAHPALMGSGFEKYAAGASYNGGPGRVRHGLKNFGLEWLYPVLRFSELESKSGLTSQERREYQWLRKNRSHETFIYLNKLHALERSQDKLLVTRGLNGSLK